MKVLLIGPAPGPADDGGSPLDGGVGAFILKLSGLMPDQLRSRFEATNLLAHYPGPAGEKGDAFPIAEGRAAADELRRRLTGRTVVFLGANVARAFGEKEMVEFEWRAGLWPGFRAALVPHPSGVNLFWNSARNRAEGGRFFGALVREIDQTTVDEALQSSAERGSIPPVDRGTRPSGLAPALTGLTHRRDPLGRVKT